MEWTADVSAGEWLRDRIDRPGEGWTQTMHGVVPRGYPAYARVFHSATRDRPVGEPWPGLPYAAHARDWEAFQQRAPQIDTERVRWADAARAFGRTMHPLVQWERLVADPNQPVGEDGPRDAEGWRYGQPAVGTLDEDVLARVAAIAAAHTSTPDDGYAAVWEGHGGLVGAMGLGPSRALLTFSDDADPRHDSVLGLSVRDRFNDVFRKPTWQPGLLSDEISRGERLELPNRAYVLFRAAPTYFADEDWAANVPWFDADVPPWTASPGLLWPADRAWVLITEVDFDSTVVAGSPELVAALCADEAIEALPLNAEDSLAWDADRINR